LSKLKPKTDLIKNFNWEVLRVRRQLKLTQMKLGTAVGESELTIRMLERGVVPDEYIIFN
jgi:DNA-binding XRE family transcriptional regulator